MKFPVVLFFLIVMIYNSSSSASDSGSGSDRYRKISLQFQLNEARKEAQEEINNMITSVESVRNKIDSHILHVSINNCLRPIYGTYKSIRHGYALNTEEAIRDLVAIGVYIPLEYQNARFYQLLAQRHYYVDCLINKIISSGSRTIQSLPEPLNKFIKQIVKSKNLRELCAR